MTRYYCQYCKMDVPDDDVTEGSQEQVWHGGETGKDCGGGLIDRLARTVPPPKRKKRVYDLDNVKPFKWTDLDGKLMRIHARRSPDEDTGMVTAYEEGDSEKFVYVLATFGPDDFVKPAKS